jgi:hypothetical protein
MRGGYYQGITEKELHKFYSLLDIFSQKGGKNIRYNHIYEVLDNLDKPYNLKDIYYNGFSKQYGGGSKGIRWLYKNYYHIKK